MASWCDGNAVRDVSVAKGAKGGKTRGGGGERRGEVREARGRRAEETPGGSRGGEQAQGARGGQGGTILQPSLAIPGCGHIRLVVEAKCYHIPGFSFVQLHAPPPPLPGILPTFDSAPFCLIEEAKQKNGRSAPFCKWKFETG